MPQPIPIRALAAVAALLAASPAIAANAPGTSPAAPPAGITFVMPADGAFIPGGAVVIAGRLPEGDSFVNLILDGAPLVETLREGRTFQAKINPGPGRHEVEARAGELSARLAFAYGSGGQGAPPYRFHKPVLEGRCAECHAGVRRPEAKAEAQTCLACHRKLAVFFPYVHGPLAAGRCLVCHDAHGSSWPALTVGAAKPMCVACHDQRGTMEHVESARSQVCYFCHNPHASMNRKFLYDIVK